MYMHGYNFQGLLHGPGSFMSGPFGLIFSILFWGLVIWLFIKFISLVISKFTSSGYQTNRPIDILKERYAKGEISKTEFEQMKRDIE